MRKVLLAISVFSCFSMFSLSSLQAKIDKQASNKQITQKSSIEKKINWQKWTEDLFDRADRENKLVILDLEAVWCHWCHVMDQETYASKSIIDEINSHYIPVRVDQDSRPDLANKYEDYGWPATIIFSSKGNELAKRSGFIRENDLLKLLDKLARKPLPEDNSSNSASLKFLEHSQLNPELRDELEEKYKKGYDLKNAAWSSYQKFLDHDCLEYALTKAKEGDKEAENQAKQSLNAAVALLDPVWGGVYQYSTDGDWQHPHFEKIMQIQSDYIRAYALAYLYFADKKYLDVAESIAKYLTAFLLSPEGAFYTSQDADLKPGEHSQNYFNLSDTERKKLGIPRIDKHIYSRENAWAIRSFTLLYMASGEKKYLDIAQSAAKYVLEHRTLVDGGFSHDSHDVAGPYLGDTLSMGSAFLELYQATADRQWLKYAENCANFINSKFKFSGGAGYATASSPLSSINKPEPLLEENIALLRFVNLLSQYTGNQKYKDMALSCMSYLATPEIARKRKILVAGILLTDREIKSSPAHITIVGAKQDPKAQELFKAANSYPVSYKRVEWLDPKEGPLPNPDSDYPEMSEAAAFACANQRCSRPVFKPEGIASTVEKMLKSQ